MQYNPEELNEILNIYKAESEEIIQELNDGFMALENNPQDKTPLKKLFQLAHSLKGASRMLGINTVQDLLHKIEDVLYYWEKNDTVINADSFQIIYQVCDYIGELIDKAVKNKTDCSDENVYLFINQLDNLIVSNHLIPADKPQKNDKDFINSKSIDINAIILELMFVLEKDNVNDDMQDVMLVVSENLKQLAEIFSSTDYKEIKDNIAALLSYMAHDSETLSDINTLKQKITELRSIIYSLYKDLNISSNIHSENTQPDKTLHDDTKDIIKEEHKTEKEITSKFDFVLSNLQKIKYEKSFIKDVLETLKEIIKKSDDKRQVLILNKTVNILNLLVLKDAVMDNDCYMLILQCIYLAKRLSLKEKEENPNNLNFLIQRLSVLEDMFNITDIRSAKNIAAIDNGSVVSLGELSNVKKNLKSFDLQEIKTLRVDTVKLDNLISQAGELLINGIKTREHVIELAKINSKLIKWNSVSKKIINYIKYLEKKGFFNYDSEDGTSAFYRRAQGFFLNNAEIINEINNDFTNLYNMISEDDNKLHQTVVEIETIAKGIRVLPLATLFHSFPRMIRDIAKENNKKIDFIVTGSDTTVDKKIIEEIKMPLIHILRNSVSHGIETPEDRLKNNKPETGVVSLTAKQVENNVVITIEDDGYGINLEKVKEIALEKGLLTEEEILNLTNDRLMKLLFLPGFSTEDSVSEISGRGIGLDVVKTKITNLNGDIMIDSVLNKGCKVTVRLPLSMSIIKTFVLLVNNQKYALPVSSIKFVKRINKDEIINRNGEQCIIYDEHSIPVYFLSQIFGENNPLPSNKQYTVIILENQDMQAAFIVDKLLGDQEVFQKKLAAPILKIKNISGFTTLSTGEICLIINPYELMRNTITESYRLVHIKQLEVNEE